MERGSAFVKIEAIGHKVAISFMFVGEEFQA